MFESLTFQSVSGARSDRRVQMLALSTCGFCRRGQEFLESHGFAYEFLHLDSVPAEVKAQVKEQFKATFGDTLSYPALIVDDRVHVVGYVKRLWEDALGLPHADATQGGIGG